MRQRPWQLLGGAALLAACALGGATLASGAASAPKGARTTTATGQTTTAKSPHTPETALTGDVLAKVTAAAIASAGGSVDSATTENDSSNAAAVYEAHVTKADGSHVTVILDKNYAVLSVETARPGDGHGHGHGPGSGETPLTGDTATKATAAAVAKTGGTADRATTENDSSNAAAAYEVHVTRTDGSHVTVILDKNYAVLTVETQPAESTQHARRH